MAGPSDSKVQNILPVQALFNIDNSFNTFLGQGQPFVVSATESIGITDVTSLNATLYPTLSPVNTGQVTSLDVTSTKLSFNPSTGTLSATTFNGALSGTATATSSIANGVAGNIPYQTAPGVTSFVTNGTTGQVLTSNGSSAPAWTNPTSSIAITDDTTTNSTRYPLFTSVTTGSISTEYTSSTKFQFNPSTGFLTATGFSGSGANLTNIPNSALTNSSVTIGSTSISLGSTATTLAGLTSVTSTTFVGALSGNATSATTATTATNATNIAITDDTSTATSVYPTFVTNTTGNLPAKTSSTKLSFVPSTGTLSTTNVSLAGYEDFASISAPTYNAGRLWYDSTANALAYYNDVSSVIAHISQDLILKVINNTGSTIANGSPVYITSTSSGQTYPNIALAKADVASTSAVIGLTNGSIANGAVGYVTAQGGIDGVNTGTFTVGQVLYLSPYSAGQLMNTIPPTGITVQVGVVSYVNSSTGKIYVKQTTPLNVPASIISGQVAIANGGTNGTATPTAGAIAYGSGTAYAFTSAGTSGQVLTSAGSSAPTFLSTIDGIAIGGTTPSTGTFTTLTAQTEVLKGTGQNLLIYSENFGSTWVGENATITTNTTTSPTGSSNANTINEGTNATNHDIYQNFSGGLGVENFTFSCYLKYGTRQWAGLTISNGGGAYATAVFDLVNGTITKTTSGGTGSSYLTSTITSAGNGWYRCSVSGSQTTAGGVAYALINLYNSSNPTISSYGYSTYTGTSNYIYAWGAQIEIGSTLNTYISTTTAAVYGTPSLSFSGVAGLGLQSDGSLYVSPAGTGALQAQKTDSTATGGNARGANAVDWQTNRNSASQVANGQYAVIGGGYRNTSSNFCSVIAGGESNTVSGYSAVLSGGTSATVSGTYAFGGGGYLNTTSGNNSAVVSGYSNTSAGFYNFVGTGYTNSGTSASAVTTQSGTMNGTTAVTLSGSNASIKVGQLVTGTSISNFPHTYVAAISGTSLTLSQNASGSSTNTLTFYTPHGVVVGGGNNQATGSYSFIGGGGDAGTAGNRNVASGDWSVVVGGRHNTASGIASFVGGGGLYNNTDYPNTASGAGAGVVGGISNAASGANSFVGGGYGSTSSGQYSSVLGGFSNTSSGTQSTVIGGSYAVTRSIDSLAVIGGGNPLNASSGMSQTGTLILARQTTDATATVLASNLSAAGTNNQVILPNNSAYYFRGEIIAGVTGAGNTAAWTIEGAIKRGSGVGTTAIVGTVTINRTAYDSGASGWSIAVTADTTNGGLAITVTGQASTTIRWVCSVKTTEMTF